MKCSDFEELISAYANDELSRTQREFIEEHLSVCSNCRKLLADYIDVKRNISLLKDLPPLPDMSHAIMSQIGEGKKAPLKLHPNKVFNISHKPLYRSPLAAVLSILILVLGLSIGSLIISDNIEKAQAAEIAMQDLEIQALIGDDEVGITVENAGDDYKFVILQSDTDYYIVAKVNTSTNEVIERYVLEINNEFKQKIIEIAGSNEKVQELLEQGAVFTGFDVSYGRGSHSWIDSNGEWQHSETFHFNTTIRMDLSSEQWWYIHINLDTNEVTSSFVGVLSAYHNYKLLASILAYLSIILSMIGIVGAIKNKKPAIIFVKFVPIALFMWWVYVFFFNPILVDAAALTVIIILLVLGVVAGSIGIKKSTSKKGKILPIIGIVFCLLLILFMVLYFIENSTYGFIPF